jgi:hypothetical protein
MQPPLETGEYEVGSYKVQQVSWDEGEWRGPGYWLQAVVTNRRLLVYPERDVKAAESIQPVDIIRAWNICLRGRDGLMVELKDKRRLYMLVDWSQGNKLARDIGKMITPPAKPRISPRLTPQPS